MADQIGHAERQSTSEKGISKKPLIGMQRKAQTGAIRRYCEDLQGCDAPEYRVFRTSQKLRAYSMRLSGHFWLGRRMEYAVKLWGFIASRDLSLLFSPLYKALLPSAGEGLG
jgi:hypothetical protein